LAKADDLQQARTLIEANRAPEAWGLLERYLLDDPEDPQALIVAGFFNVRVRNYPLAYLFARRLSELIPRDPAAWINLVQACKFMQREKEGERAARQGLSVAKLPQDRAALYQNLASIYMDAGRFADAEPMLAKALELEPEDAKFLANLGMCQLARHDWVNGWKNYRSLIGTEERVRQVYNDPEEQLWDGAPGQTVLLYGDQGLGDEVCFASMVNDAAHRCDKLILNVDRRLERLFRRSFPQVEVHGRRDQRWNVGQKIDASLPLSQAGEYLRLSEEDFDAQPYLKADSDRVLMWRSLFATKRKPVIGIAWTGGLWHTGSKYRHCTLDALLPLFESIDAHWVSLQYKDASAEIEAFRAKHPGIDLVQYPHATLTQDYDDTASLVAALDHIVAVPTAVVHLAGALGTPCVVMQSPKPCWKFANGLAFHPDVELIEHCGGWRQAIDETAKHLRARFQQREAA
jgi:tetratricopeptide (TPR) repeat protein